MANLVQLSEMLKGMPDQKLTSEMQTPTGQIPPFLVAAEAARRQDIRQRFAPKPGQTSVIDDLISQTSVKEGVAGLAAQQPPQGGATPNGAPPPAGINALAPPPQQAMAHGGQVQRRFLFGGEIPGALTGEIGPQTNIEDPNESYLEEFSVKQPTAYEDGIHALDPLASISTATPRKVAEMQRMQAEKESMDKLRAEQEREQKTADVLAGPESKPPAPQPAKSPEETDDEYRARLAGMYETPEDDSLTGIRGSEWFAASAAFQDGNKPFMQQLANAGQAVSSGVEQRYDARKAADLEREKVMWDYDFKKDQSAQSAAAAEAQYQRARNDAAEDNRTMSANQITDTLSRMVSTEVSEIRRLEKERADLTKDIQTLEGVPLPPSVVAAQTAIDNEIKQRQLMLDGAKQRLNRALQQSSNGVMDLRVEVADTDAGKIHGM